jgi:cytochrome o ubiquinol oxidase subunit 2
MPKWSSVALHVLAWLVPAAIVGVLAVMTWTYTHRLDPYKPLATAGAPLEVQVVALDWKWLFIYPQQGVATVNLLVIPVGRPVSFDITSDTVMNAFFIPQLGGQVYAMAGMRTELHLLADRAGTYFGENTQYNGRGFPYQNFEVLARPQADFDIWVSEVKQQGRSLHWPDFQALQQPSVRVSAQTYKAVDDGLFERIIRSHRAPEPS